jgi:hypothetical protein
VILTIRWRDGDFVGELTVNREFEDGDVIDLTALPKVEPGTYTGDTETGELVREGRPN